MIRLKMWNKLFEIISTAPGSIRYIWNSNQRTTKKKLEKYLNEPSFMAFRSSYQFSVCHSVRSVMCQSSVWRQVLRHFGNRIHNTERIIVNFHYLPNIRLFAIYYILQLQVTIGIGYRLHYYYIACIFNMTASS